MEFLVHIKMNWPSGITDEDKARITKEERARAAELIKNGNLVRMWRVPCRFENWGLWRAADATELHKVITSLPGYINMFDIDVLPLAAHPVDPVFSSDIEMR